MIEDDGFDSLMRHCEELDEKGQLANRIIPSVIVDLITRLRQAEKDAARYRWLRDDAPFMNDASPLVIMADECGLVMDEDDSYSGVLFSEMMDAAIDEAMNASNN